MEKYIKQNLIPIILTAILFAVFIFVSNDYFLYANFAYYLILLFYMLARGEFSFEKWKEQLCSGKRFWINVAFTGVGFFAAFVVSDVIVELFPNVPTGTVVFKVKTWYDIVIFAATTMLIAPIAEELFFRKSMISFRNKRWTICTSLLSMLLFASEHATLPLGIFATFVWAIPLTVSYVKTKNIFVPMTAHLISNVLVNGLDTVFLFI